MKIEYSKQLSPVDGKPFDLGIYQACSPLENGYVPHIKRRYQFTGNSRGKKCNFPVEIQQRNNTNPQFVYVTPVFADNCWFCPDYWIDINTLTPVERV